VETTIERIGDGSTAIVAVSGEIDASNFQGLIDVGRELRAAGTERLIIDMSDLSYMASSGLVALYSLVVIMRGDEPPDPEDGWSAFHAIGTDPDAGANRSVKLLAPQPQVSRVLERTGLTRYFDVYLDRDMALASF
jgi:anti-anti-sigma regulatory factor